MSVIKLESTCGSRYRTGRDQYIVELMMQASSSQTELRLDKWLWAARFFKTRSAAAQAVSGGKVHVNNQRVKPSRGVHEGDELQIHRGPECMTVTVRGLSAQRRGAPEAQTLYEETQESAAAREQARLQRQFLNAALAQPAGRPNKRERRHIRRFTGKE